MESLHLFMASLQQISAVDASESFDKQALLEIHDSARQRIENVPADGFQAHISLPDPIASSGTASSVPLERLTPISLTQLQVGKVHRGRVLYGTLCAEAFMISGIMTLLEDDNGRAVRLAIYNAIHSQTNITRLYPRGAKLAIRDPYFKRAGDGSLAIRIENPDNIEMHVAPKEKCTESLLHVDVEELRKKGNSCVREKRWEAAAEDYTQCIDAALIQLKNISNCLLHAYSNRAETMLQVKEFELALEDSDKALGIDSGNLKALYRKGRALAGLGQYAAACEYLEKALKASNGQKEIQDALRQAKVFHAQSRSGKYDISDFLLGLGPPPEVDDIVGPVEIKMTADGRGRGMFSTQEISTGQLFLVSNAFAVAYEDNDRSAPWTGINVDHRGKLNQLSQEDLVAAVVSAARNSQRLLQQLYSLDYYSAPVGLDVPSVDLFRMECQMPLSQAAREKNLQVDVNSIRDIISRNSFSGPEQTFSSKSRVFEGELVQQSQNYSGLWLLPSFINHSCLPNSTRMAVGSAMFIHASKPIKMGEEITISYFDTLAPLPQRQAMCKIWGFKCKCRRCILELSLQKALEPITSRFQQLHDRASEEINAARSQKYFNRNNLSLCAEFGKIFVEAEKIIRSSALLKGKEKKNWIRASFVSAYFVGTQSNDFLDIISKECVPSGEKIMEAIQNTVPGDIRTLVMAAQNLNLPNYWMEDEYEAFLTEYISEQASEACIRVFGRHSEDVIKALVLQHSEYLLF